MGKELERRNTGFTTLLILLILLTVSTGCMKENKTPKVKEITISVPKEDMDINEEMQLMAEIKYDDNTKKNDVKWISMDETTVTVNKDGIAKGIKPGSAVVKAEKEGKESSVTIKVSESVELVSISLRKEPEKLTYVVGEVFDKKGLKVEALYSNKTVVDITSEVELTLPDMNSEGKKNIIATYKGKTTLFEIAVKKDGIIRIHFYEPQKDYSKWGLHIWGASTNNDGENFKINDKIYNWFKPLPFDKSDEYGVYVDIPCDISKNNFSFIIHKGDAKDVEADRVIKFLDLYKEVWIIRSNTNIYVKQPDVKNALKNLKIENINRVFSVNEEIIPAVNVTPVNSPYEIKIKDETIAKFENGKIKTIKEGETALLIEAGGLFERVLLSVFNNKNVEAGYFRLNCKRYQEDYEKVALKIYKDNNEVVFKFNRRNNYGKYVDIPTSFIGAEYLMEDSADKEVKTKRKFPENFGTANELWIMQGGSNFSFEIPELDKGALKLANSWGKGGWEKKSDGYYFMTYDSLKKAGHTAFFYKPLKYTKSQLVAVINIAHSQRSELNISFGTGNIDKPLRRKEFKHYGGSKPFPKTNIVIDLSELLPLENKSLFMEVKNNSKTLKGALNSFVVEYYNKTEDENIQKKEYVITSKEIGEDIRKTFVLDGVEIEFNKDEAIKRNRANSIVSEMVTNPYEVEKVMGNKSYGYSERDYSDIAAEGKLKRYLETNSNKREEKVPKIDWSESQFFPPIHGQDKASCVSWSLGYYIATFYEARENNWNVKKISAENSSYAMSPDFIYSLTNYGVDNGTGPFETIEIMENIGIASMKEVPYRSNAVNWGNEAAFREAIKHRVTKEEGIYFFKINTDEDIDKLKKLLRDGYLLTMDVINFNFEKFSSNDTLTSKNYDTNMSPDHVGTIVGYDDEWISK